MLERENIIPPPPAGHNNPPDPIETLRGELAVTHADLVKRSADLSGMAARLPAEIDSEAAAEVMTNAVKMCTAFAGDTGKVETTRKAVKQPYLDAERAIDNVFGAWRKPVNDVKAKMVALLTAWDRKKAAEEKARRDAEAEVARKAAEVAAATATTEADLDAAIQQETLATQAQVMATARPVEMTRARTDLGVSRSLRSEWKHEVQNAAAVPREYLSVDPDKIKAAMKANTKDGKCTLTIPGVRIYEHTESRIQ